MYNSCNSRCLTGGGLPPLQFQWRVRQEKDVALNVRECGVICRFIFLARIGGIVVSRRSGVGKKWENVLWCANSFRVIGKRSWHHKSELRSRLYGHRPSLPSGRQDAVESVLWLPKSPKRTAAFIPEYDLEFKPTITSYVPVGGNAGSSWASVTPTGTGLVTLSGQGPVRARPFRRESGTAV